MRERANWRKRCADLARNVGAFLKSVALAPLHQDVWRVIPVFAIAALILFWIWSPLGWIGVAATVWCASLFRNPARVTPDRPRLVVSPIDGIVTEVGSAPPPVELALGAGYLTCVSVALSPWESHLIRAPAAGRLAKLVPGDDAEGEFTLMRIETEAGAVGMALVAQGFGRRVRIGAGAGATTDPGQPLGLVLFAGRVDLFLRAGTIAQVAVGQRMVGGETILAAAPISADAAAAPSIPPESE